MAARRGKSQARRSGSGSGGLPGWAWMVLGIVLTIVVVLAAPKLLRSDGEDGFFRPKPNPDARPAAAASEDDEDAATATAAAPAATEDETPAPPQYDFYTLLPGQEVAMSDAELAASARAEEERQQRSAQQQQAQQQNEDAADLADPGAAQPAADPAPTAAATSAARYLLQAGAFSASGDAEALKARIALLGLSARVESAEIGGKTVYRVRMGPYGSASELAEAKQKLGNGGLPAMAIKAQ